MKTEVPNVKCIRSIFTFPLCDLTADVASGNDNNEDAVAGLVDQVHNNVLKNITAWKKFVTALLAFFNVNNCSQNVAAQALYAHTNRHSNSFAAGLAKKTLPDYCKIRV